MREKSGHLFRNCAELFKCLPELFGTFKHLFGQFGEVLGKFEEVREGFGWMKKEMYLGDNYDVKKYMNRNTVFISYSQKDKKWLDRLLIQLKFLEREFNLDVWADTKLRPGSKWKDEISAALNSARVAILLVSPSFLASDFISDIEVPELLEAAKNDGAKIIPVIINHSFFEKSSISQFQAVNKPSDPLISLQEGEQDRILHIVADEVLRCFQKNKPNETEGQDFHTFNHLNHSLSTVCLLLLLKNKFDQGQKCTITEINNILKFNQRKLVVNSLNELRKAGLVLKEKKMNTLWSLSDKGKLVGISIKNKIKLSLEEEW